MNIKITPLNMGQLYQPTDLFLKMTDYCPNNCLDGRYCFAQNTPAGKTWLSRNGALEIFKEAKECGIVNLVYVSCEPFADFDYLLDITAKARQAGLVPRFLGTSGYKVGDSLDAAVTHFTRLKQAGFDLTIAPDYIGTGYDGIDVSIDQFHPQTAEQCANTILGALKVFGPTHYVNCRITHPNPEFDDSSKKNRVIELLVATGEVTGTNAKTHELYFLDGSVVFLLHLIAHDDGNAAALGRDLPGFFQRSFIPAEELSGYKDLREFIRLGQQIVLEPFHKVYLDQDGSTNPCLSRLPCLAGGNVYEIGVKQVIQNINDNPLVPVLIHGGLAELLELIQRKAQITPSLCATGPSTVGLDLLTDTALMQSVAEMVTREGIDKQLRASLVPALERLRKLITSPVA